MSPQTERLTAEQIKDYRGVFEMFDEEGNGQVKTGELVWLMGLLGINPTKSELASMAKDMDRVSEAGRGSPGRGGGCCATLTQALLPAPCRERLLQLRQLPGPDGRVPGEGAEPGA